MLSKPWTAHAYMYKKAGSSFLKEIEVSVRTLVCEASTTLVLLHLLTRQETGPDCSRCSRCIDNGTQKFWAIKHTKFCSATGVMASPDPPLCHAYAIISRRQLWYLPAALQDMEKFLICSARENYLPCCSRDQLRYASL